MNRDWINNVKLLTQAKNQCIQQAYLYLKKLSSTRLLKEYKNEEIFNQICINVLLDENISHLIDKQSYEYIENKISEFKLYNLNNKDSSLDENFHNWIEDENTKYLISHKQIFLKRTFDSNHREIATDQYHKDDQTNTSH